MISLKLWGVSVVISSVFLTCPPAHTGLKGRFASAASCAINLTDEVMNNVMLVQTLYGFVLLHSELLPSSPGRVNAFLP